MKEGFSQSKSSINILMFTEKIKAVWFCPDFLPSLPLILSSPLFGLFKKNIWKDFIYSTYKNFESEKKKVVFWGQCEHILYLILWQWINQPFRKQCNKQNKVKIPMISKQLWNRNSFLFLSFRKPIFRTLSKWPTRKKTGLLLIQLIRPTWWIVFQVRTRHTWRTWRNWRTRRTRRTQCTPCSQETRTRTGPGLWQQPQQGPMALASPRTWLTAIRPLMTR
jgi:hypothetical protein